MVGDQTGREGRKAGSAVQEDVVVEMFPFLQNGETAAAVRDAVHLFGDSNFVGGLGDNHFLCSHRKGPLTFLKKMPSAEEFMEQLDEKQLCALQIARRVLGPAFVLEKCAAYLQYVAKCKK
jgi:hypothetical protein